MKKEIVVWRNYPENKPVLIRQGFYLCQIGEHEFRKMYWDGSVFLNRLGAKNEDVIAWTFLLDGVDVKDELHKS